MERKKVLFVCTHNSARSQMAEGFLKTLLGEKYEAFSAGTHPKAVHPLAVRVMKEAGVDISQHRSKNVDEFLDLDIDIVVTVCDQARETCPYFPGGKERLHHGFPDPSLGPKGQEKSLALFRRVRDEIKGWLEKNF